MRSVTVPLVSGRAVLLASFPVPRPVHCLASGECKKLYIRVQCKAETDSGLTLHLTEFMESPLSLPTNVELSLPLH